MKGQIKRRIYFLSLSTLILIVYCEYAIYYVVLFHCSWPSSSTTPQKRVESQNPLKALFLADTHLLGPVRGHWLDKLRREWQMHRSFQTAIQILNPEAVFFLGDVFDEGELVTTKGFDHYVQRFRTLFSVPASIKTYVIVGNHDIGFHYWITPTLKKRFESAFNSTAVRRIRLKDVNFILINSMAMEGDGCFLCKPATKKIIKIGRDLACEQNSTTHCSSNVTSYSRPILLQHFPLYRRSDSRCTGDDAPPDVEKNVEFRPSTDCLSSSSSQFLLEKLEPRLILSGHTHHYCLYHHSSNYEPDVPEYSVPSFSWRNRDNPSFFLGHFTWDDYQLSKCYLPRESTIITIYYFGLILILLTTFKSISIPTRLMSTVKFVGILVISMVGWYAILRR